MFETLGITCQRGQQVRGRYTVGELADGSPVTLPVRIMHGKSDGPVVSMSGMVHGDEYNGLAAINQLFETLDPARLSGTLIGFPMGNPFAFITKSRISALDYERLNLNRVFPGHAGGLIVERVAAAIFDGAIRKANYHLDLHEGGFDFIARYLIVQQPPGEEKICAENLRLARAFGHGIPVNQVVPTPQQLTLGRGGTSTLQASLHGVPALTIELGGGGCLRPDYVQTTVDGVTNVLIEVGAYDGELKRQHDEQLFGHSSHWPRPTRGGIWEQVVELGQVVEEGQTVGYVRDAFGDVVEELTAPFRSVIFDIRNTAAIMTGEWTVHCGKLD